MYVAGVSNASRAIRDAAGWIRWPSRLNSSPPSAAADHDLPVEDVPPGRKGQLREVAVERLAVARLNMDGSAVNEGQCPETIVFRLIRPPFTTREHGRRLGELGQDRWTEGQSHAAGD